MQFKLLNFHKFVGNFATSLVGTFIPLMIYKATGNLRLVALFLIGECVTRVVFNHVFKKLYTRYPQLMLMIRTIPLLIYNISLIFLEDFMVVGIIVVTISYGMNLAFKNNANGVLLNYTSRKKSSKKLTSTRIVEALSAIVAAIAGGLFIDWNQTLLIIFSMVLYIISVLPLFVFFITNKGKKGFNKDFTSNAAIEYDKDPELKLKRKRLVRKFVTRFLLFYAIFCVVDNFTTMYSLHLFVSVPTFAQAGYLSAVFQFANLVGVMFVEWISKKMDLKVANFIFAIICAIPLGIMPFIQNYALLYTLIFIFGFAYSICSYFMMNSLLTKCKIISATNRSLLARQDGAMIGKAITPLVILIGGIITPVFFAMMVGLVIYSIYSTIAEERMRKELVDYIENNEIESDSDTVIKRQKKEKSKQE